MLTTQRCSNYVSLSLALLLLSLGNARRMNTSLSRGGGGGGSWVWPTLDGTPTALFSHSHQSSYIPRHTVGFFWLAAAQGADFVDTDVVMTKDGILICYPEKTLKGFTDIEAHPKFSNRRGNYTVLVDGKTVPVFDDWLVLHFTVAELKELRLDRTNKDPGSIYFNYVYPIPTFQEYLDTVHEAAFILKRRIGIIPELKNPSHHNQIQPRAMETTLLNILGANGYPVGRSDPSRCTFKGNPIKCGHVIVQNFELGSSYFLSSLGLSRHVEQVSLVYDDVAALTRAGWDRLCSFSHYIGIPKETLVNPVGIEIRRRGFKIPDPNEIRNMGGFMNPDEFVPEAHRRGVKIAIYSWAYPASDPGCGDKACQVVKDASPYFFHVGVDAMFIEDIPDARVNRVQYGYESMLHNCWG